MTSIIRIDDAPAFRQYRLYMQVPHENASSPVVHSGDGNDELRRSVLAMTDLLRALKQASGQMTLAANLYSAGAQRFLSIAARSGASEIRIAALAKVLDLRTPESVLQRLLTEKDIEKAG